MRPLKKLHVVFGSLIRFHVTNWRTISREWLEPRRYSQKIRSLRRKEWKNVTETTRFIKWTYVPGNDEARSHFRHCHQFIKSYSNPSGSHLRFSFSSCSLLYVGFWWEASTFARWWRKGSRKLFSLTYSHDFQDRKRFPLFSSTVDPQRPEWSLKRNSMGVRAV